MKGLAKAASSGRYKVVSEEKSGGATYTPKNLADFVAAQMVKSASFQARKNVVRLLDPATGDGELLLSLLAQLVGHDFSAIEVHGFETDARALNLATARIKQHFPRVTLHLTHGSFLDFVINQVRPHDKGGLFENEDAALSYDFIIANPPYVRTQIMGAEQAQLLASQFGLTGRVDLYYAFIVGMAHVLKPGGIGGIIVSNRFMTTKSGGAVRQAIRKHFNLHHVWDLGDTRLFEAAVLPAVLLVEKYQGQERVPAGFTSIYATNDEPRLQTTDIIAALACDGVVKIADGRSFVVKNGTLDINVPADAIWRVSSETNDNWLSTVAANTWCRFGDIGKIRVGVKTCADKVFIRADWRDMPADARPELLRPLTTHHMARRFRAGAAKKMRQILYPHQSVNGERSAVDLAKYPKTAAYLEQYRSTLEGRIYVTKSGRQWFEIWVPQDPSGWGAPKLVFRDISEEPVFWLDLEGTIVNGDCYWLTCAKPENTDFLWLAAAVANSSFIEAFYDHSFNNKLYAGRRRFITQYVERFPLPNPELPISRTVVALAKQIYEAVDASDVGVLSRQLDRLVWEVFGISAKEISG
ncbi:MAG: N-6 DNA methylase [Betaproteobacteria bacterium]|nr:N-6 DNA methylase [Betaproteobacteria bacterium]MCL2887272.1 N-6 DNA methylase [Betaproteobacteria bacterium]